MNLTYPCVAALEKGAMFENEDHRFRFSELMSCYSGSPFFSRGLCKCMYLSAWDDEHFLILLDMLNDMTLSKSRSTQEMSDNGTMMADAAEGYERLVIQMSDAFLHNREFTIPDVDIPEPGLRILQQGLEAAKIIDSIFEKALGQS